MKPSTMYLLGLLGGGGLVLDAPTPTSPADDALLDTTTPTLVWTTDPQATSWRVQIAVAGTAFAAPVLNVVIDAEDDGVSVDGLEVSYELQDALDPLEDYEWRVAVEAPVASEWSAVRTLVGAVSYIQQLQPAYWLDSDFGVYEDTGLADPAEDGDAALRWVDRGSLAKNTARISADGVTYHTNVVNGHAAVRFNGTSGYMQAGAAADWTWLHNGGPVTLFVVVMHNEANPERIQAILSTNNTGSAIGMTLFADDSSTLENRLRLSMGNGSTTFVNINSADNVWPVQQVQIAEGIWESGITDSDVNLLVDGSSIGTSEMTGPAAGDSATTLTLGSRSSTPGLYASMDVFQIIAFQRRLTTDERANVRSLLSAAFLA